MAFLSQARNSQETAAFAAVFTEIKLKVRRLDSNYYKAAFHNPISHVLSRELCVCLSIYKIAVETKRRTCDFLLGCQVLSRTARLHNDNVRDCFESGSSHYWSQNIATSNQRQLPAPPRILGKIY